MKSMVVTMASSIMLLSCTGRYYRPCFTEEHFIYVRDCKNYMFKTYCETFHKKPLKKMLLGF